MKKKILAITLCVAMLAIMLVSGTLAYFTDKDQVTNEFSVGGLKIDLFEKVQHVDGAGNPKTMMSVDGTLDVKGEENTITLGRGDDKNPGVQYQNIMPGDVMTKKVTVENKEEYGAYVALTVKQENYNNFNKNIDDYFEGKGYDAVKMQQVIDDIFSGKGWNGLSYDKKTNGFQIRYYPAKVTADSQNGAKSYVGSTAADAVLIAVDYTVDQGSANAYYSCGYINNMFNDKTFDDKGYMLSYADAEGDAYSTLNPHDRIWVYYLYLPAGKSYTLDLTVTCPTYMVTENIAAFEDMAIDVQAAAIQVDGFKTAKDAFTELYKTYDFSF